MVRDARDALLTMRVWDLILKEHREAVHLEGESLNRIPG
jgi:hypothetical protein